MSMANILKQAQKMQGKITRLQEELENERFEGSSGGGLVKAVVNGKNEMVSIKISKEAVNPEDIEILEDLVIAAYNSAKEGAQKIFNEKMGSITAGMKIPGLM